MILRIGNKKKSSGFTLIEVMVAVSILAFSTLLIQNTNLLSMDVYNHYLHLLNIQNWAEEKVWEAKEAILSAEIPSSAMGQTSGQIERGNDNYQWTLDAKEGDSEEVFNIDLEIKWKEGNKDVSLSRLSYAFKEKPGGGA